VTFGYGNACPDALVTDFLVNDTVPAERETVCEGIVADEFVPVAPRAANSFEDLAEALSSIETEIYYLPEFFYWDGYAPTSVGCTYGGILSFDTNEAGTTYNFEWNRCQLIANITLTGSGSYEIENDHMAAQVRVQGRWNCTIEYERNGEQIDLNGNCSGKSFNLERSNEKSAWHEAPRLKQPNED